MWNSMTVPGISRFPKVFVTEVFWFCMTHAVGNCEVSIPDSNLRALGIPMNQKKGRKRQRSSLSVWAQRAHRH